MPSFWNWRPRATVAARRHQAERETSKLLKKGRVLSPVVIRSRKIAGTFWGTAWCRNLEAYSDYANRLPRGRSYARNGMVIHLEIDGGSITALVRGSSLYKVSIVIASLPKSQWKAICRDSTGEINSLIELLQGRFSTNIMERICRQREGLFPSPREITLSCSCPDVASMCKHVSAVLYGVGARLDEQPELLFRLRAVDENDLVSSSESTRLTTRTPPPEKLLVGSNLSELFGLHLGADDTPHTAEVRVRVPARRRRPASMSARRR